MKNSICTTFIFVLFLTLNKSKAQDSGNYIINLTNDTIRLDFIEQISVNKMYFRDKNKGELLKIKAKNVKQVYVNNILAFETGKIHAGALFKSWHYLEVIIKGPLMLYTSEAMAGRISHESHDPSTPRRRRLDGSTSIQHRGGGTVQIYLIRKSNQLRGKTITLNFCWRIKLRKYINTCPEAIKIVNKKFGLLVVMNSENGQEKIKARMAEVFKQFTDIVNTYNQNCAH